jgi:hypothetical protein
MLRPLLLAAWNFIPDCVHVPFHHKPGTPPGRIQESFAGQINHHTRAGLLDLFAPLANLL